MIIKTPVRKTGHAAVDQVSRSSSPLTQIQIMTSQLLLRRGKTVSVDLRPLTFPMSIPHMIHEWVRKAAKWYWQGKRKDLEKTGPRATLCITNATQTDLGAKRGLHGKKTCDQHRLCHGKATITSHFLNINLPSATRSSKWFAHFKFSDQKTLQAYVLQRPTMGHRQLLSN
jgi:hypothetical protein